jgi:hypothetical protein
MQFCGAKRSNANPENKKPRAKAGLLSSIGLEVKDCGVRITRFLAETSIMRDPMDFKHRCGVWSLLCAYRKGVGMIPQTRPLVEADIRQHVELLHNLATRANQPGKLVVASYGQDPDALNDKGVLGDPLTPKVQHLAIGDVNRMVSCIVHLSAEKHRNVYVPFAIMRADLPKTKKGFEADVVALLVAVTDFDDDDAKNWQSRLPLPANYVLETSPGRYQAFHIFDEPVGRIKGKVIAERLQSFTRCDYGTRDVSHVWRIPGCLNYPNAVKVHVDGRSRDPAVSRIELPWAGDFTSVEALTASLKPVDLLSDSKLKGQKLAKGEADAQAKSLAEKVAAVAAGPTVDIGLVLRKLPEKVRDRITGKESSGDRSKDQFFVVRSLIERNYSDHVIVQVIRAHPDGVGAKWGPSAFSVQMVAPALTGVRRPHDGY